LMERTRAAGAKVAEIGATGRALLRGPEDALKCRWCRARVAPRPRGRGFRKHAVTRREQRS